MDKPKEEKQFEERQEEQSEKTAPTGDELKAPSEKAAEDKLDSEQPKPVEAEAEISSDSTGEQQKPEATEKEAEPSAKANSSGENESGSDPSTKETDQAAALETEEKSAETEPAEPTDEDDLEAEDDTPEIEGDDDDDRHPEEQELPDYAEYPPQQLIRAARSLIQNQPIQHIKQHIEAIRKSLLNYLNKERQEKLEAFKAEGGSEIDFEYNQPLRDEFRELYRLYKKERRKYYVDLEKTLKDNLQRKQALIEQLKEIVNKEESIGKTFKEYNDIVEEWRKIGPVPRSESHNLWQTYRHHRENFFEYIDINKELRDLDYKKNREAKEKLIAKAQELSELKDLPQAFSALQKLHKEWKHIGPVEKELREELWERFSELTKLIHDKREAYYQELREKRGELIEVKKAIVARMAEIPVRHEKHGEWQKAMKKIQSLVDEFKAIGRINHAENDSVWEEYREVLKNFNHHKNEFYKELKKEQAANLEKKRALLEEAEKLKDSEDWKETANRLKKIQADWKKIGHVPRKDSDKIWKQFRAACNHFFERLNNRHKAEDEAREQNLEKKKALLNEFKAQKHEEGQRDENLQRIKTFMAEWRKIGPVPRGKGKIDEAYNKALDEKFKALDMDREEKVKLRFANKMKNLEAQGDAQLQREKKHLRQKREEAERELAQLETNMNFFRHSDPKSPIVKEAQKKLDAQREVIEQIKAQQKMLNIKMHERANQAKAADESSEKSTE